jgi:hypothetical protein
METAGRSSRAPCLRERIFSCRRLSPLAAAEVSFGRDGRTVSARVTKSSWRPRRRLARCMERPPNRTGAKSIGSTPPWRPVRYRAPEAIESSFRQADQGEIEPSFVRRCPRFLHLLPFQSAYVHPRAGCRRQISRRRRGLPLRPCRPDCRGGNCRSRRKVNCRPPPNRTLWTCRGQRRRERGAWFRRRIQRERGPEGEVSGGQNEPGQGMGQCQECASGGRDHTFCCAHGIPFKSMTSWSESWFHSNRITF